MRFLVSLAEPIRRWRLRRREQAILTGARTLVDAAVNGCLYMPVSDKLTRQVRDKLERGLTRYYDYHWPGVHPHDMFVIGEVATFPLRRGNGGGVWAIQATVYLRGVPCGKMEKYTVRCPREGESHGRGIQN